MTSHLRHTWGSLAIAVILASTAFADPDASDDAAPIYEKAATQLRELLREHEFEFSYPLPDELTETQKTIVAESDDIMRLLREGLTKPRCTVSEDFGAGEPFPLIGARQFARLAQLRAHAALLRGEPAVAADELITVVRVARQIAHDSYLINQLVSSSIDRMAIERIAEHVDAFDAATIEKINDVIASDPPPVQRTSILDREYRWALKHIESLPKTDLPYSDTLREIGWTEMADQVDAVIKLSRDEAEWDKAFEAAKPTIRAWMDAQKVADDEMEVRLNAIRNEVLARGNPIEIYATSTVEGTMRMHHVPDTVATQRTMLKAGMALRHQGRDAFNTIRDPHGDGPFELIELEGNAFELRSKRRWRELLPDGEGEGEPLSLRFNAPPEVTDPAE